MKADDETPPEVPYEHPVEEIEARRQVAHLTGWSADQRFDQVQVLERRGGRVRER